MNKSAIQKFAVWARYGRGLRRGTCGHRERAGAHAAGAAAET